MITNDKRYGGRSQLWCIEIDVSPPYYLRGLFRGPSVDLSDHLRGRYLGGMVIRGFWPRETALVLDDIGQISPAIMSEPQHCRICGGTWPREDHFIGNLGMTKAYLFEDQYFPGWTVLVLKVHRTELFQLPREERTGLIEEVSLVGEALGKIFDVRKINYELLGNQVPHIHWHVIPRLTTDPDPLKPVWGISREPVWLPSSNLAKRLNLLRSVLGMALGFHGSS